MAKKAIGTMSCQCCGKEVVVKENERGTLSYTCQWCDDSPYQKAGTLAFSSWQKKMAPMGVPNERVPDVPQLPPVQMPHQLVKPKPAAKSAGTFFD